MIEFECFYDPWDPIVATLLNSTVYVNDQPVGEVSDVVFTEFEETTEMQVNVKVNKSTPLPTQWVTADSFPIGGLFRRAIDGDQTFFIRCYDGCVQVNQDSTLTAFSHSEMNSDFGLNKCVAVEGSLEIILTEK